jgi:hypothetical protein
MNSFFSIRSLERAAKRMPDGAAKEKLLDDVAALREAKAAAREVRTLVEARTTAGK